MLFPPNYPINPEDLIFIEMHTLIVPLFRTSYPAYCNQDMLKKHGLNEIEVTPVLYERKAERPKTRGGREQNRHEILLYFDPEEFPTEDYGFILGDITFGANLATYFGSIFPRSIFGEPEYTSLDEQNDDYVSMRYPIGDGCGFSDFIRKDIDFYSELNRHDKIRTIRVITPLEAERYRQSVEPRRPDHLRPKPPQGLFTGMWMPK